jgi:hypothetical protein
MGTVGAIAFVIWCVIVLAGLSDIAACLRRILHELER